MEFLWEFSGWSRWWALPCRHGPSLGRLESIGLLDTYPPSPTVPGPFLPVGQISGPWLFCPACINQWRASRDLSTLSCAVSLSSWRFSALECSLERTPCHLIWDPGQGILPWRPSGVELNVSTPTNKTTVKPLLYDRPVSWRTKEQTAIARSSAEAEHCTPPPLFEVVPGRTPWFSTFSLRSSWACMLACTVKRLFN